MLQKIKNLNPITLSFVSVAFSVLSFYLLMSVNTEGKIIKEIFVIFFAGVSFVVGSLVPKYTGMRVLLILSLILGAISFTTALLYIVAGFYPTLFLFAIVVKNF